MLHFHNTGLSSPQNSCISDVLSVCVLDVVFPLFASQQIDKFDITTRGAQSECIFSDISYNFVRVIVSSVQKNNGGNQNERRV